MEDEKQNRIIRHLGAEERQTAEAMAIGMCICGCYGASNAEELLALGVTAAHFGDAAPAEIFACVERLAAEGRAIGLDMLWAKVSSDCGSAAADYLLDAMKADSPAPSYAPAIARHLDDFRKQRRVEEIQRRIEESEKSEASWSERREKLVELTAELAEISKPPAGPASDPFTLAQAELVAMREGTKVEGSDPIRTGIDSVDRKLRPLDVATGDYYCILFAVTGSGKSSLATQMFGQALRDGKRCAAFLGETSTDLMIKQIAAQVAECDLLNYATEGRELQQATERGVAALRKLWQDRLFICDDNFVAEEVCRRCRAIAKEAGKIDFVVIDHLHLLKSLRSFPDERVRYNYMSSLIKPLAIELRCPVMVLAQPNRTLKTEGRPPKSSDLKESGSLEDDADRIWAIHIPPEDMNGADQTESIAPEGSICQLKFRRGHQGRAPVIFRKRWTKFEEWRGQYR